MTIVFSFRPGLLCCVAVPHSCSVLLCGVVFASGWLVFMTSLVQRLPVLGFGGYMDCAIDGSGNGLRVGSISDGMYLYRPSIEGLKD